MDDATRDLLRESLVEVLATRADDLPAALAELGWDDVIDDDAATAWTLLAETQGRVGASTSALDLVAFAAAGLPAMGEILWPYPGDPPREADPGQVRALCLREVPVAPWLPGAGEAWNRLDLAALTVTPVRGFDPTAGWSEVRGEVVVQETARGSWPDAWAAARRMLASELVGVSTRALDVAVQHVSIREQFGRPIGSFQAVRHRLAESYAWIEGARSVIRTAWARPAPATSAAAKAVAGRAHADTARQCMQVCGGMGLSAEHPLPAAVARGYMLDALAGHYREIATQQGGVLAAGADLRTLVGAS